MLPFGGYPLSPLPFTFLPALSLVSSRLRHSPAPLGHSSWSGAPNYTSRVTDENRDRGSSRERPVPLKRRRRGNGGGEGWARRNPAPRVARSHDYRPLLVPVMVEVRALFRSPPTPFLTRSLAHPPSPANDGFFIPLATKGSFVRGQRARLFYTPNVIQRAARLLRGRFASSSCSRGY